MPVWNQSDGHGLTPGIHADAGRQHMPSSRPLATLTSYLALLFVALCLIPVGAHFFEMFAKLRLPQTDYMTVQQIYAGWALFGIPILAALLLLALQAVLFWRHPAVRWLTLAALLAMAMTQAIFWRFTYPINVATQNWTRPPTDFEAARLQWEYSHAANAGLTLLALCLLAGAMRASARDPDLTSDGIVFRRR